MTAGLVTQEANMRVDTEPNHCKTGSVDDQRIGIYPDNTGTARIGIYPDNIGNERTGIYPANFGDQRIGIYPQDINCCGECCVLTCELCGLGLAYCFCIRPASRSCRVSLVSVWTILLTLIVVLVVKYGFYGSGKIRISPTDEQQVKGHISSFLCHGFKMASVTPFNAYRFEDEPEINKSKTVKYDWKKTIFLDGKTRQSRGFYLLEGSVAKAKTCADELMSFCIIKGERDFRKWQSQPYCPECCQKRTFVKGRSCDTLSVTALDSDQFYFVFNRALYLTWVDVNIHLVRTTYDSDKATKSCVASATCELSLSYLSGEIIVVQGFPERDFDNVIQTTCVTRSLIYVLIFVIPAVTSMCILTIYIHFKCKDPARRCRSRGLQGCRPPLIARQTFRYQTFTDMQPPAYEETSRTVSPPSYQDVVNTDSQ